MILLIKIVIAIVIADIQTKYFRIRVLLEEINGS